jgi:lipopolysaccharide/colanic/teichoic acid biosynthesis glycosyltransferase
MPEKAIDTPSWRSVGASRLRNRETANDQAYYRDRVKRILDIVAAATLFVVISPLLVIISAVIKLDSKGPILFEQRRRGLFGKPFTMYKFRTMLAKEQDDHAIKQSQRNDPRVTRFGSLLRRYSLDELPQLFNVLRGDMSLVGPRPHALGTNIDGQALPEICHQYMLRYAVRPGITGWAQVNGHRGILVESQDLTIRVDYDIFYIKNSSLMFDVRICAITVLTVFRDSNAF